MPYYHKEYGVMSPIPWDSHSMEVVSIQALADHRFEPWSKIGKTDECARCVIIFSLEEALTNYLNGV